MLIDYRVLTMEDIPAYRQLRLESLQINPECFGSNYEQEREKKILFFEEHIASQSEHLMLGAFSQDTLTGLCGLIALDDEKYMLVGMYVTPQYRGFGIAGQLICQAQAMLVNSTRSAMILTVYEGNNAAIGLYEQAGFYQQAALEDEIIMQWDD